MFNSFHRVTRVSSITLLVKCQMSNVKNQMSNVKKVKLLSERTSGVPPVIFEFDFIVNKIISSQSIGTEIEMKRVG